MGEPAGLMFGFGRDKFMLQLQHEPVLGNLSLELWIGDPLSTAPSWVAAVLWLRMR